MTALDEPLTTKKEFHKITKPTLNTPTTSPSSPVVISATFMTHHPKAGLNPLVDAAAYLFSVTSKLKQVKSYRYLNKLYQELVQEINVFQEAAKNKGYSSEYILVSRYALCATLDDIIMNTPWGSQGQWDNFNLLTVFNHETGSQDRFFILLERIIKDPALYIDLMEFMYICLSLGFKGSYRSSEFNHHQLEHTIHTLYKHIRAHRGEFSKVLSPFPVRGPVSRKKTRKTNWFPLMIFSITIAIIITLFIGLGHMLDSISNQAYQSLLHIGNT